jgi:microcystin-dependent protein
MSCVSDTNSIELSIGADGALTADLNVDPDPDNLIEVSSTGVAVFPSSFGVPVGAMIVPAGPTLASGWLACDGSAVSRATYASLFATIGTNYGAGDGVSTFNLPFATGEVFESYTEFVANVPITGTTEATANQVVAAPAFTFDGATLVEVTFSAPSQVGGANWMQFALYDGAASIGIMVSNDGTTIGGTRYDFRRFTPSAASHTFSIRGYTDTTGTVYAGAGGLGVKMPGWIKLVGRKAKWIKT